MSIESDENARQRVLRSEFAGDPDMQDILELFVREMPQRVQDLRASWERQEFENLGRMAHQLKGAGGGYGFGVISDAAAVVEKSVTVLGGSQPTQEVIGRLKSEVDALIDLCRRVSAR